ncbi:protease modulator HflK [Chelatococcus sambhunathii]|uniref:Protease modulator HflK n=1 Tax=Chelatococcus sambhunathii TaxID=363953 RepID=A0ABU1DBU0_9HYPH|nr:protease modulator HflK [Chelatococcus sambhunathii]MDR4305576.1 protease modulator HflK [Chelatococcus sambhunathii]
MPWSNQSGGGGGGGPWRNNPGGPWGQGPQRPNGGGPTPPDLDEMLRRAQERFKGVFPGGGGGGKGALALAAVALIAWGLSGFYRVEFDEEGIVLRFGEYVRTTQSGLNYHLPYPIETVLTPKVTTPNSVDVGMRSASGPGGTRASPNREVPQESLMLTGDGNIVDVNFSVVWVIKPPNAATGEPSGAANYLFKLQNPEGTVKAVAESAMREVVGRSRLQQILTEGTPEAETPVVPGAPGAAAEPVKPVEGKLSAEATAAAVREVMQKTLDGYESGILIRSVQLQKIAPPGEVIGAFREVQAAQADRQTAINKAQGYANSVVPGARGKAVQTIQAAEGFKASAIAEAQGQGSRFSQVVAEYKKAPEVTRERIFLETMERVYGAVDKVIIDQKASGQGVVPYLPLEQQPARPGQRSVAP